MKNKVLGKIEVSLPTKSFPPTHERITLIIQGFVECGLYIFFLRCFMVVCICLHKVDEAKAASKFVKNVQKCARDAIKNKKHRMQYLRLSKKQRRQSGKELADKFTQTQEKVMKNMTCDICASKEKIFMCKNCTVVGYCGRQHQKQDWKSHKQICKQLNQFRLNKRYR